MPDFTYIARNLTGQRVTGTLSAGSEREVVSTLSGKQLFPLKVAVADKKAAAMQAAGQTPKVKATVVAPVYSQLAALLRSGVPLLRSLQVLEEQSSSDNLRVVLADVRTRVEDGATLSEAMAHSPRAFDELSLSIIRAGGEGGFMEDALERVAKFAEQQGELKARVTGALAYPVVLMVMCVGIVTALMVFIVPSFDELFDDLRDKGTLPILTIGLLAFSNWLQRWGLVLLVAFVGLYLFLRNRFSTPEAKRTLDQWRLKIPAVSKIYLSLAVSRFCRVLGTLLNGGVPIVRSLDIAADSTGNRILAEAVREAADNISAGQSLAEPLAASGHFPRNVTEMIAVAEQSNNLEIVLTQIADTLEKDTWRKLDLAVRMIEPLLLVILSCVVLVIIIALLYPVLLMSTTV